MGWWRVKDLKTGGIDFDDVSRPKSEQTLINGDKPADLMGDVFCRIDRLYKKEWGRPVTSKELRAIFNFSLPGFKYVQIQDLGRAAKSPSDTLFKSPKFRSLEKVNAMLPRRHHLLRVIRSAKGWKENKNADSARRKE